MAKRSEQKQRKVQSLVTLGRTAAEMTARTLTQGNLNAEMEAAAREKLTSHLKLQEERKSRPGLEASKHKTSETGFNHSSTPDAIASSEANSDQDRSSSPVFESDEEEEEEIARKQVNVSKVGGRSAGSRNDSGRKRKKSRNTPVTQTKVPIHSQTVKPLVPRSPVIASCPTRLPIPQDFTSPISSSLKEKSEPSAEAPASRMSPGTSAATTTTSVERPPERVKKEYSPPSSKRPRPPSTLDIDGRRESGRKARVSSDSSSSHSSRSGRGGGRAIHQKGKVSTEVDCSGSTRVLNKSDSLHLQQEPGGRVDTIDSCGRKERDEAAKIEEKNVPVAPAANERDGMRPAHSKPSIVIKLSRRFRGVKASSKEFRTKSKSENRARKALRTISFILGAFVLCW